MEKREYAGARKSYLRPIGNQAACSDNRSYDQMHKQIQQAMERTQSVLADITHWSDNEQQGCGCGQRPEPRTCGCGQRPEPRTCGCGQRPEPRTCGCGQRPEPRACGCGQRPEPRTVDCGSCVQRPEAACGCQKADCSSAAENGGCNPVNLCENVPLVTAYIPPQPYTGLVSPETALARGSSFTNLYWPWGPGQKYDAR